MAGARPDTWMPLYIGDYLSDTMHLSHVQHGIYLLLIMAYWRNGGPLPDDAGQLSAIAKCSAPEWRKHLPIISRFFHIDGGEWAHKRIDAELGSATEIVDARREAGRRGGLAARGKSGRPRQNSSAISSEPENDPTENSKPNSKPNSKKIANEWQKNTPSPSPEEEEERCSLRSQRARGGQSGFDEWWEGYPHKVGKGQARKAWPAALAKTSLGEISAGVQRYIATKPPDRNWCNPATWLSGERWLDDPGTAPHQNGPAKQSPVTTLYEGAMRAADKLDREEADRVAGVSPARALLDGRRSS